MDTFNDVPFNVQDPKEPLSYDNLTWQDDVHKTGEKVISVKIACIPNSRAIEFIAAESNNAATYGFNPKNTMRACCGYGGPHNYNLYVPCGQSGFVPPNSTNFVNINKVCSAPQAAIQWDGIHLTQAFYRQIAKLFLKGQFVNPPLNLS